jgi:hypothetical protein
LLEPIHSNLSSLGIIYSVAGNSPPEIHAVLLLGRRNRVSLLRKAAIQSHFVAPSSQGFGRSLHRILKAMTRADRTHAPYRGAASALPCSFRERDDRLAPGRLDQLRAEAFVSLLRMQALERAQHIWKNGVVASAHKRLVEVSNLYGPSFKKSLRRATSILCRRPTRLCTSCSFDACAPIMVAG